MHNPDAIKTGLSEIRETTGSRAVVVLFFDDQGQMQLGVDGLNHAQVTQALSAATSSAIDQLLAQGRAQA